ncbi:hypothetical protein [Hyphomicrobium sulfonivorans]|uniref:hypothetical protein n=1 Tax=Hyphomicrobium sulfonivorans TaxID=121290 RepID=UPI0015701F7C|nr:hypothetical protein [Hyphomicrobium sulfonivorans]MBI1649086.1 hypothetical protein [Hyphomicrobium sulfonivorans]NSL70383.1 hypothetical protein [Hyphomicrobium sulfonivorans]
MSQSRATERSILTGDQLELVGKSHHPEIYDIDAKALRDLQKQIRAEKGKVRTLVRQRQRELRGKAEARGGSFPGNTEHPLKRKQALSAALKRVNRELARQRALAAREANVDAARRALAARRQANFTNPAASDRTRSDGMQPIPNRRRRNIIPGSQIGSVSKATQVAQAKKDNRG